MRIPHPAYPFLIGPVQPRDWQRQPHTNREIHGYIFYNTVFPDSLLPVFCSIGRLAISLSTHGPLVYIGLWAHQKLVDDRPRAGRRSRPISWKMRFFRDGRRWRTVWATKSTPQPQTRLYALHVGIPIRCVLIVIDSLAYPCAAVVHIIILSLLLSCVLNGLYNTKCALCVRR